jgi:signal transduction histidine kinase/CheY-like chemotaxis protein
MVMLSSFYLLPRRHGFYYALLSVIPIIFLVIRGGDFFNATPVGDELASPGYEALVVLNFLTIVVSHYLYHESFAENVEEKEALNLRLQEAVEEAVRAGQSKADFLSTMSHELRTPLNSIIGMSELLLDDPHNQEQAENLKILSFSAVNLHSLVNDILDFNKLDLDKLELEAISVDLHELLNNISMGLRFHAKEKGLLLTLDIEDGIKGRPVITDPTRISQIIYNLAGNAIKFTAEGGVSIRLRVMSQDEDNTTIRFSVTDTGIGISEDKHAGIFEPFVQASTSTTRNYGGSGLGLAIVKRLVRLFGSEVSLLSSPGHGSNFSFDLTLKLDKQPTEMRAAMSSLRLDLSSLRILVAEDNAMNRLLLKKVFSKWNTEPAFAENGQEAVERAASEKFDVILMDIHMPVMDGYEAAKEIRRLSDHAKSSVPIIALTASVSGNLDIKIREAGMDDFVQKPFNSIDLYSKLKNISTTANRAPRKVEVLAPPL